MSESEEEDEKPRKKPRAAFHRVKDLGGGMMGGAPSSAPKRKRLPKLAFRNAITSSTIGNSSREKSARLIWRERLLGLAPATSKGKFHDEAFIEYDAAEGNDDDDFFVDDSEEEKSEESDDGGEDGVQFSWRSKAIEEAGQAVANRKGPLLDPYQAASTLGYEDVSSHFWLLGDGTRREIKLQPADHLPSDVMMVDYNTLRAFNSGGRKGWGVCCMEKITKGMVLGEACGRCLTEQQFEALENKEYVFGFDDSMLEKKRAANDELRYVDLKEYGNMTRLINDSQEAPNLALLYWPPQSKAGSSKNLPKRFFLYATREIPPLTEVTWDYGSTYVRPWLKPGYDEDHSGEEDSDSDGLSDSDAETEPDAGWTAVNWAICDACEKWRRLPPGPDYCEEALPDKWYCWLNAPHLSNTCDAPEDEMEGNETWTGDLGALPAEQVQVQGSVAVISRPKPVRDIKEGAAPALPSWVDNDVIQSNPVPLGEPFQVSDLPSFVDGPCTTTEEHAEPTRLLQKEVEVEAAKATAKLLTDVAFPANTKGGVASAPSTGVGGQPMPEWWEELAKKKEEEESSSSEEVEVKPKGKGKAKASINVDLPPKAPTPPPAEPAVAVQPAATATSTSAWAAMMLAKKKGAKK